MTIFKDLLLHGYFPSQAPPCFASEEFAKHATAIRKSVDTAKALGPSLYSSGTRPDQFSVARSRRSRRPVTIPNPIAQLELSYLIARNWKALERRMARSSLSQSKPQLSLENGRAITFPSHSALYEMRLSHASTSRYALISDISQYFPSLYTHTVAWAIHGRDKAKKKRFDKSLLGNRLDSAIQQCQHRQTIGIPIGCDTSHIIAELVGSAIDEMLVSLTGGNLKGYRHVDDFALFYDSLTEAEQGLTALETATRAFELKLNPIKTKIVPVADLLDESWSHELQTFSFSPIHAVQRRQIHHFFELSHKLLTQQDDDSVIRYALGRMSAVIVKRQNWDIFQAHLLRCALAFPSTIEDVALLFYTYHTIGYEPDLGQLESTINLVVSEHLILQHHSELAWALWLALYFKVPINCAFGREQLLGAGSTTQLLLLELLGRKQLGSKIDRRWLRPLAQEDLLFDEGWLFTYEASQRGWISAPKKVNVAKSNRFFSALCSNLITFFKPERLPQPLFKRKPSLSEEQLTSDEDIATEFEYSEIKKSYQGAEILQDFYLDDLSDPDKSDDEDEF